MGTRINTSRARRYWIHMFAIGNRASSSVSLEGCSELAKRAGPPYCRSMTPSEMRDTVIFEIIAGISWHICSRLSYRQSPAAAALPH